MQQLYIAPEPPPTGSYIEHRDHPGHMTIGESVSICRSLYAGVTFELSVLSVVPREWSEEHSTFNPWLLLGCYRDLTGTPRKSRISYIPISLVSRWFSRTPSN